jgi:hypothetical protein
MRILIILLSRRMLASIIFVFLMIVRRLFSRRKRAGDFTRIVHDFSWHQKCHCKRRLAFQRPPYCSFGYGEREKRRGRAEGKKSPKKRD